MVQENFPGKKSEPTNCHLTQLQPLWTYLLFLTHHYDWKVQLEPVYPIFLPCKPIRDNGAVENSRDWYGNRYWSCRNNIFRLPGKIEIEAGAVNILFAEIFWDF